MRRLAVSWATFGVCGLGAVGCFVGGDAAGLPCNADLDCGLHDRCIEGFCGGPPSGGTTIDPSTTSTSASTSDSDPSTGALLCDGKPGAVCEPELPGIPDAQCDGDCTLPHCGDAVLNPAAPNDGFDPPQGVEECDEGQDGNPRDTPTCDADCTLPACGDVHVNPETEPCDDGNPDEFDGCTAGCQVPLLAEQFDLAAWTSVPYDLSAYDGTGWAYDDADLTDITGWRWADGRWNSGAIPYRDASPNPETYPYNYAGVTQLVSPSFDLPPAGALPPGYTVQLRFWHSLTVEAPCARDVGQNGDGGVLRLAQGASTTRLTPDGGYMSLADAACDGSVVGEVPLLPNPLFAERGHLAFTGASQDGEVIVDLTEHLGKDGVQIIFEFGVNCRHCTSNPLVPSQWQIDDVIVAAFPSG